MPIPNQTVNLLSQNRSYDLKCFLDKFLSADGRSTFLFPGWIVWFPMDMVNQFRISAFAASLLNAAAAICMLLFLRPGLVPLDVEERMSFIASNALLWKLTWGLWVLAALSLICFFIHWAWALDRLSGGKYRGLFIFGALAGSLGMIPDTLAETLYLSLIPKLATDAARTSDPLLHQLISSEFMKWEYLSSMFTGFLGNGFYCVGGLTLNLVAFKVPQFPKFWAFAGLPIWVFGFGLTLASFMGSILGLQIFTALTMISYIVWSGALSLFFLAKESS